jgi:TRAP-type C4-dicarboxylate transport system permease small subunit
VVRHTPNVIKRCDVIVARLATGLAIVGELGIVALICTIAVSVFWRYVLNDPIFGINDFATLTLILVAGASVAYGARNGAHVSIDVISQLMGPKMSRIADVVMLLATFSIISLACYALFVKACGFEKACVTSDLNIEHRYFYYYLGVCLGVYALEVGLSLLKSIWGDSGASPMAKAH